MLDAETREKKQNIIEHAWRVYLFYFFDLWQNISLFVTAVIYTPKGFIGVASSVHIIVCIINLGLLQTVDMYGTQLTVQKQIINMQEILFMDRQTLIDSLQKHEWINFMSVLHSVTASLDIWTLISSITSVYTCVHRDYIYLKGHVLWVIEPCNSEMHDLGFVFATVSVFAGYNLITCFSQINMITHYGKQHVERVVYIVSPIVTFNTGLLIIVALQHLSMLQHYADNDFYGSVSFIYYSVICLCGILTAIFRPRNGFINFVCTFVVFVDFILSVLSSAIGFSQLISPKSGDNGHNERLCRFFGDDEINEDQIGDLILFTVIRCIQVFVNIIIMVCLSVLSTTKAVVSSTNSPKTSKMPLRPSGGTKLRTKSSVIDVFDNRPTTEVPSQDTLIKHTIGNMRSRSRIV